MLQWLSQFVIYSTLYMIYYTAFRALPKSTIREFVKQLNANIKDAVAMAEKMRKIKGKTRLHHSSSNSSFNINSFLREGGFRLVQERDD